MFTPDPNFEAIIMAVLDEQIEEIAEDVLDTAQAIAPVDTGEYRDSIEMEKIEDSHYEIVAHARHSAVVEAREGTMQQALGAAESRIR